MIRCILPFTLALVLATGVRAQNDAAALARDAMNQLDVAHASLNDATRAQTRVAALSETIHALENGLDALRLGLRRASLREAAIRQEFETESETVSRFLGVLLSIQSASGPLALLHPSGALGTARSGMIVSEITPAIQRQADELRDRLNEVAVLRALQESAAQNLQQGLADVQNARTELSLAISNRTDLPQRFVSDPTRVQKLIDSSETLAGFASGLTSFDIGDIALEPNLDFAAMQGALALPVQGTVLHDYNQPDAAGIIHPGLLIATRPLSLLTSPWPATIRFRGPLLDYGNVLILEPDAGTLMILAGLGTVYGQIGQVIPMGTAIGLMGGENTDPNSFVQNAVNGAGSNATETLYIELRIDGLPVDPGDWFAQTKE